MKNDKNKNPSEGKKEVGKILKANEENKKNYKVKEEGIFVNKISTEINNDNMKKVKSGNLLENFRKFLIETKTSISDIISERFPNVYKLFIYFRKKISSLKNRKKKIKIFLSFYFYFLMKKIICDWRLLSIIVFALYLLVGAFVFKIIEEKDFLLSKEGLAYSRRKFLAELKNELDLTSKELKEISRDVDLILRDFDKTLIGEQKYDALPSRIEFWSFEESFKFCFIVLTTIGSGGLVPRSTEGRIVTIVFAMFGIPLCLNMYFRLAALMFNLMGKIFQKKNKEYKNQPGEIGEYEKFNFIVSFTLSLIFTVSGALYVSFITQKNFSSSFFYIFLTLSTIGMGDESYNKKNNIFIFIPYFCIGYTLLVVFATSSRVIMLNYIYKRVPWYRNNKISMSRLAISKMQQEMIV